MKGEFLIEKEAKDNNFTGKYNYLALFSVLLITAIIFSGSLKLEWTNWDDDLYVYKNPVVSKGTLKDIFTTPGDYKMYVPLVIASFALEWKIAKDSPFLYHLDNLLLHLVCTGLVLLFFRRVGLSIWWSGFAALLFGIHPLRVEAVAWITERKELFCALFYLATLIVYTRYVVSNEKKSLLLTFFFLFLALLSKPEALTLPFALVLLDWYFQRKIDLKVILEKAVFFAFSLAMTLPQYFFFSKRNPATTDSKAIANAFNFFEQTVLGGYSYAVYTLKSIVPYAVSALYPIPASLRTEHWIGAFVAIVILACALAACRKYRFVTFGLLFFTLNICFLILISFVGSDIAFLNDRYTYIAYIGLFFMIGMGNQKVSEKLPSSRLLTVGFAVVLLVPMCILTARYIPVWKNSETLWGYVIEKYPRQLAVAHLNRGNYWYENNQFDKAMRDFSTAIEINPDYSTAYFNRSTVYFKTDEMEKALQDYNHYMKIIYPYAIKHNLLKPYLSDSFSHRGSIYVVLGHYEQALDDFNAAIKLDPLNLDNYYKRALTYMQLREYDTAIRDFSFCHQSDQADSDIINNRGVCYLRLGKLQSALADFDKAILLNRAIPSYYLNRAIVYSKLGQLAEAERDVRTAEEMGAAMTSSFKKSLHLR